MCIKSRRTTVGHGHRSILRVSQQSMREDDNEDEDEEGHGNGVFFWN